MQALLKIFKKENKIPKLEGYDPVIRQLEEPEYVVLPLHYPGQVRYTPVIEVGDVVRKGQVVARSADGDVLAASISGEVREISTVWTSESVHCRAIVIDNNNEAPLPAEEMFDGPVAAGDRDAAVARMRASGIPPFWTVSVDDEENAAAEDDEQPELPELEMVVVSAICAETTELTSQILLDQNREKVVTGLKQLKGLLPEVRICMTLPEEFRSWADEMFRNLAELYYLPQSYFGRIEREVVTRILGRQIPNREAYRLHGISVLDVEYLLAFVDAMQGTGRFTEKCLTISGSNIDEAVTVRFALGSPLKHILACQDLAVSNYTRPVIGGPMQGVAQFSDLTPVTFANGIHLIAGEIAPFDNIAPCINCGRCTRVCPAGIQVHLVNRMVEFGQLESAMNLNPEACHECGLCAYVCPAERPIVQLFHFCNRDMVHGERFLWAAGGTS